MKDKIKIELPEAKVRKDPNGLARATRAHDTSKKTYKRKSKRNDKLGRED